jgi:hypothetical protein
MARYAGSGTGLKARDQAAACYWPAARVPADVRIRGGRLWAPSTGTPVKPPIAGAWMNFAGVDPDDLDEIERIGRRFGGLTPHARLDDGEDLAVWWTLITDLKTLAGAWTAEGAAADPVALGAAELAGYELQTAICNEHLDRGGRFRPWPDGGWGLLCTELAQWWRLVAIADVRALQPMKRCRYCGTWFSTADGRSDRGFCSSAHRSGFNQRRQPARSLYWSEVV